VRGLYQEGEVIKRRQGVHFPRQAKDGTNAAEMRACVICRTMDCNMSRKLPAMVHSLNRIWVISPFSIHKPDAHENSRRVFGLS